MILVWHTLGHSNPCFQEHGKASSDPSWAQAAARVRRKARHDKTTVAFVAVFGHFLVWFFHHFDRRALICFQVEVIRATCWPRPSEVLACTTNIIFVLVVTPVGSGYAYRCFAKLHQPDVPPRIRQFLPKCSPRVSMCLLKCSHFL